MANLIVEDGSVVSGANSFVSLDDWLSHCDDRNRDYSDYSDDVQEAALVKMGDYLNSLSWKGVKTARDNPMCWPRYGQEIGGSLWNRLEWPASQWVGVLDKDGFYIGTEEVPAEVVSAQCEGAWLIVQGKDMEPALERGGQVKREKFDVIEFEYFGGASPTTEFKAVTNRLRGLLKSSATMDILRA